MSSLDRIKRVAFGDSSERVRILWISEIVIIRLFSVSVSITMRADT